MSTLNVSPCSLFFVRTMLLMFLAASNRPCNILWCHAFSSASSSTPCHLRVSIPARLEDRYAGAGAGAGAAPRSISNSRPKRTTTMFSSPWGGTGWDNDDFLSSLSEPYDDVVDVGDDSAYGSSADNGRAYGSNDEEPSLVRHLQRQQQASPYGPDQGRVQPVQPVQPIQQQPEQPQQQQQQTIQRQEVGALPLGWSAHYDPDTRRLYYYNVNDGTTTWDKPAVPPPPPPPPPPQSQFGAASDAGRTDPAAASSTAATTYRGGYTASGYVPATSTLPPEELADASIEEIPEHDLDGAELTEEMKSKMKTSHTEEEEASGGGQRFKEMMEKARKSVQQQQQQGGAGAGAGAGGGSRGGAGAGAGAGGGSRGSPKGGPTAQQLFSQLPPDAIDPTQPIEQQARRLDEYFWKQQHHHQLQNTPHPQYQSPGIGIDGRKIGRNRDADIISNTADVYLAQLKRDSTTRNLARYAGDDERANTVFDDEAIADIKPPEENPYLKERRERERNMVETVPDEMLLFQEYDGDVDGDGRGGGSTGASSSKTYSGISYKDRIAQMKATKGEKRNSTD
eukprot:CAMPEP_0178586510 /NCGR_PEP_ID=MMETSP0697-20121206/25958_1 /TAXON_ID=265572 /ORGANISM="Extubocellulus spinifer, Strain CCMP396" /LENGTH=565 /DNA_ID=CAMNT_0020222637 /DNA_START=32 /DNA_END=1729 /DNA_ORIENTATION=-